MSISTNYLKLKEEIPKNVKIVIVGKTRSYEEIQEVIDVGAEIIGWNYIQEAEKMTNLSLKASFHMIGHLQKNKINKALSIFKVIQTIDSIKLAYEINKKTKDIIPVYLQVNIGEEQTKFGIKPAEIIDLIHKMASLDKIIIEGLMTIEPQENARFYFRKMRKLYEQIQKIDTPNLKLKTLSMGMSNTYKIAINEGSNMIRIGSLIFGERK